MQPSGAAAQFEGGKAWRIVDIDWRARDDIRSLVQILPVIVIQQGWPAQPGKIHLAPGGQHALHKLFLAHFQRIDCHGNILHDGRVHGHAHGKGRLAHTWPGCHDDQVRRLQAGCHRVQALVACCNAGYYVAGIRKAGKVFKYLFHEFPSCRKAIAGRAF